MKMISQNEVELNATELQASEFFDSLLDLGLTTRQAAPVVIVVYPDLDQSFRDWIAR